MVECACVIELPELKVYFASVMLMSWSDVEKYCWLSYNLIRSFYMFRATFFWVNFHHKFEMKGNI